MKKTNKMLVLAAFFAAGLVLTACSDLDDSVSEEVIEQGGVVKAEFTISFPQQMGNMTRQGLNIVQGQSTPVFRGLQNIELRPFHVTANSVTPATTIPSMISLGESSGTSGYILASNALYTNSKSHLYKDISVPIGTRSFIFYGMATNAATTTTASANAVNGVLEKKEDGTTLADITFSPKPIYTETGTHQEAQDIAKYLTNVANAGVGGETTLTLFPNLKNVKTGSWNSVKAVVQQIYSTIYDQVATGNLQDVIIKAMLKQTWDNVEYTFAHEVTDTQNKKTLSFAEQDEDNNFKAFTFPQNVNLPDGAVYILWSDTNNKFEPIANDNHGLNIATFDKYVYPPSLYYFGLSDIKTVAASMQSAYNNNNTWAQILAAYDAAENNSTVVQSTTQSIAIVKEVQYAVGRLDVSVTADGTNGTELKDNADNYITFDEDDFPVTGIIVANQRPVDYKFETGTGTGTQYTIYDSQVFGVAETANTYLYPGATSPNKTHTLVLQTPVVDPAKQGTDDGKTDDNANVRIAIEFMNNSGKLFVGKDNEIIYPNTKFYLIGTLVPDKNTTQKLKDNTTVIKQAFVQDYVTTANFKVQTLQNAYNLLPDLRSPKLEIGMSVDLTWETGITQDIVIQ